MAKTLGLIGVPTSMGAFAPGEETAGRVRKADAAGHLALVIGGDCTVELGTVAGLLAPEESAKRLGLVYFDLHPDLNVPGSVKEGALDWMGVAHMLGEEGGCRNSVASAAALPC